MNRYSVAWLILIGGILLLTFLSTGYREAPQTPATASSEPDDDPRLGEPALVVHQAELHITASELAKGGSHRFVLRNRGDKPVKLITGTEIGLNTVDYSSVIEPGEEGHVTVSWRARESPATRAWRGEVAVHTSDRNARRIKLSVIR